MPGPRMTLEEVRRDMCSKGMKVTNTTIADAIEIGAFPFGTVLGKKEGGRRNIMIMRRDYEKWAEEYLSSYT